MAAPPSPMSRRQSFHIRGRCRPLAALAVAIVLAVSPGCDARKATPTPAASQSADVAPAQASATPPFQASKVEFKEAAMGTSVTVIAYTTPELDEPRLRQAIDAAMAEIRRLEALMSSWQTTSEVSRINAAPGNFVPVSPETLEVIDKGLWAGAISEGTFDITFQTLSGLWKFGDAQDPNPLPPKASEVARLRPHVDYRKVEVKRAERLVKIAPQQQLGLEGVAKGYIVDAAAKILRQQGLTAFLLRAGGDLYGAGAKPDGQPWIAGIQDPRGSKDGYFATLELRDRAFSTAGDYARAYMVGGKRYHHIIDPRTGYPASACRSVTIWAETALLADVIDDSAFILGPEKGLRLVESVPGVGAVIVDANNKVWVSQRLQGKVTLLHPPTPGD